MEKVCFCIKTGDDDYLIIIRILRTLLIVALAMNLTLWMTLTVQSKHPGWFRVRPWLLALVAVLTGAFLGLITAGCVNYFRPLASPKVEWRKKIP
jgi:hypothetical protein